MEEDALRAEDVAAMLGVGRNAVYELAKSGELPSYRIGRKLRFTSGDVQRYIEHARAASAGAVLADEPGAAASPAGSAGVGAPVQASTQVGVLKAPGAAFVLSGSDIVGDVLAHRLGSAGMAVARSYRTSHQALVELYLGQADAAFIHLYDRKTNTYNAPFVQRIAPGTPLVLIRLVRRSIGLVVAEGNPKQLRRWSDLLFADVNLANAPLGSGARVLLDEKLVGLEAQPSAVKGWDRELSSTSAVPQMVASGGADVGVCTRQLAAQTRGVDYLAMQDEWLDVAVAKSPRTRPLVRAIVGLSQDQQAKAELGDMGFDASRLGAIVYEC